MLAFNVAAAYVPDSSTSTGIITGFVASIPNEISAFLSFASFSLIFPALSLDEITIE